LASERRIAARRSSNSTKTDGETIRFFVLSSSVRALLPPLLFSSIPKRAIGFSYPTGREGSILGGALIAITVALGFILYSAVGIAGFVVMAWLTGGTGLLMFYNSTVQKVAFVKSYCAGCRLRPLIEEHEAMHLNGVASEEAVWETARRRYSYEGLGLGTDPRICTFCPIAKRLSS
jgi:hypothetical protein